MQEDGRVSFDLRSYISTQDMRELFQDACREYIERYFLGDTAKKLSDLIYESTFTIIDEAFKARQEDFRKDIITRITEIIDDYPSYYVFRRKGEFNSTDSIAQKILDEEVVAARPLIRARVEKAIEEYDFGKINRDVVSEELYFVIHDQLFGKEGT